VTATAVGYTGGHTANPTYDDVCTHTTGHAETVLVEFDPSKVTYAELLRVFFMNHDPTTTNRQGPDIGDQYRSEVFTFSDAQDQAARTAIADAEKRIGKKVVTRVERLGKFYKAEDYHQQYDEKSGTHSCPIGLPKGA
jgi:peptide-methionine (S)-S-oxide reductase